MLFSRLSVRHLRRCRFTSQLSPCQQRHVSSAQTWHFEGHQQDWQKQLLRPRILYFGERHEQPAIRDAQITVLQEWSRSERASLVLEMFSVEQQQVLDDWKSMTAEERIRKYDALGGDFDLAFYMPLIDAAVAAGVRVLPGFPTREAAREVCNAKISSPERLELADVDRSLGAGATDHFRLFAGMISGGDLAEFDHDGETPERGKNIFPAQCWKDLVCANVILEAMSWSRVMVVAGCGHTDYGLGIPQRLAAVAEDDFFSGRHQPYVYPFDQSIITCREILEPYRASFRDHSLAHMVLRYKPV
eukprot:TRINITY_DN93774_c0_g1_i1.p1 TRINITY_DN93774_c0_g1~~TRINITY_DN93774_c0_g1_i1.p1  ORF type:complete len:303 (-),score=36.17 TRINITY_DN93774_c0_g1_i1:225-1133(-)